MKYDNASVAYSDDYEMPGNLMACCFKHFLEMNISLDSLLQNVSLDKQWYNDLNEKISVRNCLAIISNALAESGDEALGLKVGRSTSLSEFGIWGYTIMSSRTLGEAADMALRFWKINTHLAYICRRQDELYDIWEFRPIFKVRSIKPWKFLVDHFLAVLHASVLFLANKTTFYHKIYLSFPKPYCNSHDYDIFNCPIYFDNDIDVVYIPKSHFEIPTSMGHPQVLQTCIEKCEDILSKLKTKEALIESIRNHIVSSSFRILRLEQVSEKLGMSARTLQRELGKRNATFQKILSETRQEIAEALLADTDLTIDQISDRLGFSESASFRQSFKKWTGAAPAAFRRQREAGLL